jgi:PAS domain S-box-containing protein
MKNKDKTKEKQSDEFAKKTLFEEAFKESEEKFRGLVETTSDWIWEVDENAVYTYVSPKIRDILGYEPEEVIGKTPFDLMSPNEAKRVADIFSPIATSQKSFKELENTNLHKDGHLVVLETSGVPIININGKFCGYRGIDRDITERKKAEEALQASEERLRMTTSQVPAILWTTDTELKFTSSTGAGLDALGLKTDQVVGMTLLEYLQTDDPENLVIKAYRQALKGNIANYEFEWEGRFFDCHVKPLKNKDGSIIGTIGFALDITKRKKAEMALQESEYRMKSFYNAAFEGIAISRQGKIIDCNLQFAKLFGYQLYELIGKEVSHLVFADDQELVKNNIVSGFDQPYEHRAVHKDGSIIFLEVHGQKSQFQGQTVRVTAIQDITERKQLEQEREHLNAKLKQKNKELEQIVYITSHDLRTPLVNIGGYSKEITKSLEEVSILQNAEDLTVAKEKVALIIESDIAESESYISKNIFKMGNLLSALLNLSRLGQQELKKEKLNMNNLMSDIAKSMTYQVNNIGAKLELSELPVCTGDAIQINQLFSNLLENSLKYLDSNRSGVIKISGHNKQDHSVYCIEDNGIGIAPEHQEKIFEIFYQLNPSKVEGEGLGLTISSKIVNSHGGKIWVESDLGKGSKFFVSIPS